MLTALPILVMCSYLTGWPSESCRVVTNKRDADMEKDLLMQVSPSNAIYTNESPAVTRKKRPGQSIWSIELSLCNTLSYHQMLLNLTRWAFPDVLILGWSSCQTRRCGSKRRPCGAINNSQKGVDGLTTSGAPAGASEVNG